jgi:hypothetical protein
MIRGELEDASGSGWDLRRVQQTVLKAGARVAEHGRRIFVDVAKAAGVLWGRLLERVRRCWKPPADGSCGWGPLMNFRFSISPWYRPVTAAVEVGVSAADTAAQMQELSNKIGCRLGQ